MTQLRDYENETWDEWDSDDSDIGRNEQFVANCAQVDEKAIDEALELQSISLRIPKDLLEDLKRIALIHNMGYQPLMKQVLQRFVTEEMKIMLRNLAEQKAARTAIDEELERRKAS